MISFDDLEGTLNEGGVATARAGGTEWTNPCAKCRGTGRFFSYTGREVGPCHLCKGTGKLTFKTSPEARAKKTFSTAVAKVRKIETHKADFAAEHPAEWAWLQAAAGRGFAVAVDILAAVAKFGSLTEGRMAAVQRFMAQDAQRVEARAVVAETAKGIDVSRIAELFSTARSNKLKKPVLRVAEIELALANEHGKNPGAVYVRRPADDTYLGKIVGGIYEPSFKAQAADIEAVKATAANPLELAIAYGQRTGNCSCCGRTLTNHTSVELGIGPVCRTKWGF